MRPRQDIVRPVSVSLNAHKRLQQARKKALGLCQGLGGNKANAWLARIDLWLMLIVFVQIGNISRTKTPVFVAIGPSQDERQFRPTVPMFGNLFSSGNLQQIKLVCR